MLTLIDKYTRGHPNENWFMSLDDAIEKIEAWRQE